MPITGDLGSYKTCFTDAVYTLTSTTMIKVFEVLCERTGDYTCSVTFVNGTSGTDLYFQVYKNGSPYGTEKSYTGDTNEHILSDTLAFNRGDLIQIYLRVSGGASPSSTIKKRAIMPSYWAL